MKELEEMLKNINEILERVKEEDRQRKLIREGKEREKVKSEKTRKEEGNKDNFRYQRYERIKIKKKME